jgi:hypothetical protein
MLKRITMIAGWLLFLSVKGFSQDPVHWKFSYVKTGDGTGEIRLTAMVDRPWHIYAQVQPKDAIALPTKISFRPNPLVVLQGKIKEAGKKVTEHNKILDIDQCHYSGTVDFIQPIQLKMSVKTNVSGLVSFQVCDEQRCLPPMTVSFNIHVPI